MSTQFSITEPGLKKLKASWDIRFDEELDIFTGVNEQNRITSTPFENEEISFVLSLWNRPEPSASLMIEAKFCCEKQASFFSAITLELPDGKKLAGQTTRGTMSNGSTCKYTFNVPGAVTQRYFNIDFTLGYCTNEAERFVSRKALRKYNAAPQAAPWLKSAFEKEQFSDCVIKVEGQEIKAHRVVLSAKSKVFEAMFTTKGTDECLTGVVVMKDASYEAVKAMVEYLYDGSLENVYNYVGEVFRLADKYQIEDLKYHCFEFMGKTVDEKNFCQIWASVYLYTAEGIKTMCKDFIRKHRNFLTSTEWKKFTAENKDAAIKLYEYFPQL